MAEKEMSSNEPFDPKAVPDLNATLPLGSTTGNPSTNSVVTSTATATPGNPNPPTATATAVTPGNTNPPTATATAVTPENPNPPTASADPNTNSVATPFFTPAFFTPDPNPNPFSATATTPPNSNSTPSTATATANSSPTPTGTATATVTATATFNNGTATATATVTVANTNVPAVNVNLADQCPTCGTPKRRLPPLLQETSNRDPRNKKFSLGSSGRTSDCQIHDQSIKNPFLTSDSNIPSRPIRRFKLPAPVVDEERVISPICTEGDDDQKTTTVVGVDEQTVIPSVSTQGDDDDDDQNTTMAGTSRGGYKSPYIEFLMNSIFQERNK